MGHRHWIHADNRKTGRRQAIRNTYCTGSIDTRRSICRHLYTPAKRRWPNPASTVLLQQAEVKPHKYNSCTIPAPAANPKLCIKPHCGWRTDCLCPAAWYRALFSSRKTQVRNTQSATTVLQSSSLWMAAKEEGIVLYLLHCRKRILLRPMWRYMKMANTCRTKRNQNTANTPAGYPICRINQCLFRCIHCWLPSFQWQTEPSVVYMKTVSIRNWNMYHDTQVPKVLPHNTAT